MRRNLTVMLIAWLTAVPLAPSGVSAQESTNPIILALQLWDTLELTPRQVQEIREIQEWMEGGLPTLMIQTMEHSVQVDSLLWLAEGTDTARVRMIAQQRAEVEAELMLRMFEARDRLFDVLTEEQRQKLSDAHRPRYGQRSSSGGSALGHRPCVAGGVGGGSIVSDRVRLVFSVDFEGDSARIGAVFVGKADVKLYGQPGPRGRPELPGGPRRLSGGSMESWHMSYEEETGTAWVHTQEVPLGDANVVLVEGIDSVHDLPRVTGLLRMPSPVFTGGCPAGRPWPEILLEALNEVPEIREFMGVENGQLGR